MLFIWQVVNHACTLLHCLHVCFFLFFIYNYSLFHVIFLNVYALYLCSHGMLFITESCWGPWNQWLRLTIRIFNIFLLWILWKRFFISQIYRILEFGSCSFLHCSWLILCVFYLFLYYRSILQLLESVAAT